MAARGAPAHYLAINGACLALGLALIAFLPLPKVKPDVAAVVFAALLFLPLLIGPSLNGVHRWIGSAPVALNAGLLAGPALAVAISWMERRWQLAVAILALVAAIAQPDAALALAIGGAAIGTALAARDTKPSLVAIAGLLAAIWAHKRGVLPPVDFVEQVYLDAATASPLWLVVLVTASVAGIVLITLDHSMERPQRFALAGTMAGFCYAAAMSVYPTPLVGYGAASILGLALALWLAKTPTSRLRGELH